MSRPDFYTVHHGSRKFAVARNWTAFRYGGGTYRIKDGIVERLDHETWRESVYLTISAPKGRRG